MHRSRRRGVHPSYAKRGVATRPVLRAPAIRTRLHSADRKSLLLGTALASTLFLSSLLAPTSSVAAPVTCTQPRPDPIADTATVGPLICVNTDTRNGGGAYDAIHLTSSVTNYFISLNSIGALIAPNYAGVFAATNADGAYIDITNRGPVTATLWNRRLQQ